MKMKKQIRFRLLFLHLIKMFILTEQILSNKNGATFWEIKKLLLQILPKKSNSNYDFTITLYIYASFYLYWYVIYAIVHTINLSLSLMLIMQPLLIVQGNKFKIGHANIVQMLQH